MKYYLFYVYVLVTNDILFYNSYRLSVIFIFGLYIYYLMKI